MRYLVFFLSMILRLVDFELRRYVSFVCAGLGVMLMAA